MIHSFDDAVAQIVGVDGAVLFYHIAYWVFVNESAERNFFEGKYWTYNSGKAYEKIFPFWKDKVIRNKLKSLVNAGLIIKSNFNLNVYDHTNWYTLTEYGKTLSQNWTNDWKKNSNQAEENFQSYNNTNNTIVSDTNINTKEKTNTNILSGAKNLPDRLNSEIAKIINYLNDVLGSHYTTKSKATNSMIKGRLEEGHTVDDFKKVIDNKKRDWGNDAKMVKYLRPETLFRASHFESYLNDVENEAAKRKREDTEINARQREEIRKSCEIGFY